MVKKAFKSLVKFSLMALITVMAADMIVFAQGADTEPSSPQTASFQSRCSKGQLPDGYPACATSPSECGSDPNSGNTPFNCIYLQEPIGGRPGYDLYKVSCYKSTQQADESTDSSTLKAGETCVYSLWYGEILVGDEQGPFQAVLSFEEGKESQGPFGLLYNYLGLVYNFMSGIIIAFVVLVAIIGGIRMSTSAGNQDAFGQGRSMIIKALIGMALWFTASVILYTINPTFFAF